MSGVTGDTTLVTAGQTSLLPDPYPPPHAAAPAGYVESRCRCRPGCLSPIEPGDSIVRTAAGWVLADHEEVVA